jgi:carbon-monoxide dehydrogenase medium subunit
LNQIHLITATDPMTLWQEYLQPKTVTEAISALTDARGPALILAGGTDLILDLDQGRHPPIHTIVDITSVREMLPIEIRGGELFIGASVSHTHIVDSKLVAGHAQALIEACGLIGGPQVRNIATLGGNVAHALPAADGTIALMALNAQVEVASQNGSRRMPIHKMFLGPGKSALVQNELLVGFYLPLRNKNQASAFKRIMRPQGVALPIINTAVWLMREADRIADIRIAVGPGGPKPWRALESEASLRGKMLNDESLEAGLESLLRDVKFRTSPQRASAEYRRELARPLFIDTIKAAWERA